LNIDWDRKRLTAYASKTESSRVVPITADLMPILQEASDAAPEGAVNVVPLTSHRSNLHRKLETIIQRAGLVPWDDLMQTLHRSAEPDFARPPSVRSASGLAIRWPSVNANTCKSRTT